MTTFQILAIATIAAVAVVAAAVALRLAWRKRREHEH